MLTVGQTEFFLFCSKKLYHKRFVDDGCEQSICSYMWNLQYARLPNKNMKQKSKINSIYFNNGKIVSFQKFLHFSMTTLNSFLSRCTSHSINFLFFSNSGSATAKIPLLLSLISIWSCIWKKTFFDGTPFSMPHLEVSYNLDAVILPKRK